MCLQVLDTVECYAELAFVAFDNRRQQRFFSGEMVDDAGVRDADSTSDIPHGKTVIAHLAKELNRCI